jgi:hypothetical protein
MRLCSTCGNEIDDDVVRCPFCDSHQVPLRGRKTRRRQPLVDINLKSGLPTVKEALRRLDVMLEGARSRGARVVRVIHGYGSTGGGGKIRAATRRRLTLLERKGQIRQFLPGEQYSELTDKGRELLRGYPMLENSLRTDRSNRGITLVEL